MQSAGHHSSFAGQISTSAWWLNRNVRPDIAISSNVGKLALMRRLSFLLSVLGNNGECADTNREMVGGIYAWASVGGRG